jgi:hypothetical protein
MPTNPLWLEHTERAAWDTVQALRNELERERERIQRLTRLQPTWPKLVSELDQARQEHAIDQVEAGEVVRLLSARLRELSRRSDELERQLEDQKRGAELERILTVPERSTEKTRDAKLSAPVRWFARLIDRHRRRVLDRGTTGDPRSARRYVEALELKAEELSQARPADLLELAVEIGHLALLLARSVKRAGARDV